MHNKKRLSLAIITLLSTSSSVFAVEANKDFKATATIEKTCFINADDINFGVVSSPLSSQTATSNMRIFCSNATNYTIDLSYGGIYGSGGIASDYTSSVKWSGYSGTAYNVYEKGILIGELLCDRNNQFQVSSTKLIQAFKLSGFTINTLYSNSTYQNVTPCYANNSYSLTKITTTKPAYSYGVMVGAMKANNLAYKITIPGDISKVWNKDVNAYKSVGNGTEQVIEMTAHIVPDNSSSKYLAQDSYLDTVTAIVTY